MKALSEFTPKVLESVTGQAAFVIEQRLKGAVRDFCEKTKCWQKVIQVEFDAQKEATLELPEESECVSILRASDDDLPVYQNQDYYFNLHENKLTWLGTYLPPRKLTLVVALKPAVDTESVPDFLHAQYYEAIAAKAAVTFAGAKHVDLPQYKVIKLEQLIKNAEYRARDIAQNGGARIAPRVKHHFG